MVKPSTTQMEAVLAHIPVSGNAAYGKQECESCGQGWPWTVFRLNRDGTRDLGLSMCSRCEDPASEQMRWSLARNDMKVNIKLAHKQITKDGPTSAIPADMLVKDKHLELHLLKAIPGAPLAASTSSVSTAGRAQSHSQANGQGGASLDQAMQQWDAAKSRRQQGPQMVQVAAVATPPLPGPAQADQSRHEPPPTSHPHVQPTGTQMQGLGSAHSHSMHSQTQAHTHAHPPAHDNAPQQPPQPQPLQHLPAVAYGQGHAQAQLKLPGQQAPILLGMTHDELSLLRLPEPARTHTWARQNFALAHPSYPATVRQTDTYLAYKTHMHTLTSHLAPELRILLGIAPVAGGHPFVSHVPAAIPGVAMILQDERDRATGQPTGQKVYMFSRLMPRDSSAAVTTRSGAGAGAVSGNASFPAGSASTQNTQGVQSGQHANGQVAPRNVSQPLMYTWQAHPSPAIGTTHNAQDGGTPTSSATQHAQQSRPTQSTAQSRQSNKPNHMRPNFQQLPQGIAQPALTAQKANADLFADSFEPAHTEAELPVIRERARAWMRAKRTYVAHGSGSHGQRLQGPPGAMLVFDDGYRVIWDTLHGTSIMPVNRQAPRLGPDPLQPQQAQQIRQPLGSAQQGQQQPQVHRQTQPQPQSQQQSQLQSQQHHAVNGQRSVAAPATTRVGRMQAEVVLPVWSRTGSSDIAPSAKSAEPSGTQSHSSAAMRAVTAPRFSTGPSSTLGQQTTTAPIRTPTLQALPALAQPQVYPQPTTGVRPPVFSTAPVVSDAVAPPAAPGPGLRLASASTTDPVDASVGNTAPLTTAAKSASGRVLADVGPVIKGKGIQVIELDSALLKKRKASDNAPDGAGASANPFDAIVPAADQSTGSTSTPTQLLPADSRTSDWQVLQKRPRGGQSGHGGAASTIVSPSADVLRMAGIAVGGQEGEEDDADLDDVDMVIDLDGEDFTRK